jgi:hypothetical protein
MHPVARKLAWTAAFLIAICLLSLSIIAGGYVCDRHRNHVPTAIDRFYTLTYMPSRHEQLLGLLREFDAAARHAKAEYWMAGGSLLGQARVGGLLPHDDDIDLCMREEALATLLKDCGDRIEITELVCGSHLWRVQYKDPVRRAASHDIVLDIAPVREEGEQKERVGVFGYGRLLFPEDWCFKANLYPLRRVRFHDIETFVPANAVPQLDRLYPGWQKTIYITHVHHDVLAWSYCWLFTRKVPIPITPELTTAMQTLVSNVRAADLFA